MGGGGGQGAEISSGFGQHVGYPQTLQEVGGVWEGTDRGMEAVWFQVELYRAWA